MLSSCSHRRSTPRSSSHTPRRGRGHGRRSCCSTPTISARSPPTRLPRIFCNVSDHLVAPTAFYHSRAEIEDWFVAAGLSEVVVTQCTNKSRRGNGSEEGFGIGTVSRRLAMTTIQRATRTNSSQMTNPNHQLQIT